MKLIIDCRECGAKEIATVEFQTEPPAEILVHCHQCGGSSIWTVKVSPTYQIKKLLQQAVKPAIIFN